MEDDDVVQEVDEDVVQEIALVAGGEPRARRQHLFPTIIMARQGQDMNQQAVSLVWVASRVVLPEDEPTERQLSMREHVDFEPAFFVEYYVSELDHFDQPIPTRWPPTLGELVNNLRARNHSARIAQALSRCTREVHFVSLPPALTDLIHQGECNLLFSIEGRTVAHAREQAAIKSPFLGPGPARADRGSVDQREHSRHWDEVLGPVHDAASHGVAGHAHPHVGWGCGGHH